MTNGLGGFSSLTIGGGAARNDHSVLMAALSAPGERYNIVHRLRERLYIGGTCKVLSSQEFSLGAAEKGYEYLCSFVWEDRPVWRYFAGGVEIVKEMAMAWQENTVAVVYEIRNESGEQAVLEVTPFLQFAKKGEDANLKTKFCVDKKNGGIGRIKAGSLELEWRTDGELEELCEEETYFYRYDACDGRREMGSARAVLKAALFVPPLSCLKMEMVFTLDHCERSASDVIREARTFRNDLAQTSGLKNPLARELVKSAGQFVSQRVSTKGKTILAGYPFFEDWGRDTMIALPGICLSSRQTGWARSILRTFASNEKDGLMPNLFPGGGNEPMYNTADAALLFINCVYLYCQTAGSLQLAEEMYPVMEHIIECYINGTHYNIHMDEDGLICAGGGMDQVTWMDVRVNDILPTPRHGKPVEINAYWYNALKIMETFCQAFGRDGSFYCHLAGKTKESFVEQFWIESEGCLKDGIFGTPADNQIRCNQIWAVSLPFTMLDRTREKMVVKAVYEKLYTPYGLRTLSMDDPQFHPVYAGETFKRDMAYHQGTVWVFPLGAYYLAYLKVHDYSDHAKETVAGQLAVLEGAMREGCVGQLPEIYDGSVPTFSRGCFAQAWSVGEILRVFEALENDSTVSDGQVNGRASASARLADCGNKV